jgi:hypothetical protein
VAAAGVDAVDLAPVGVETDHIVPGFAEGHCQRQAHVAEPDDADLHLCRHARTTGAGGFSLHRAVAASMPPIVGGPKYLGESAR